MTDEKTLFLDTLCLSNYSPIMVARALAAGVVVVWLLLLGIEISEAAGLINRVDTDKSVETATASFGAAFRTLDDSRLILSSTLIVSPQILNTFADPNPSRLSAGSYVPKEAQFLKERFKIHKVHQVFLI